MVQHLHRLNIIPDSLCTSCFVAEDTRHILWGCPRSQLLWKDLGFNPSCLLNSTTICAWIINNLSSKLSLHNVPIPIIFLYACHTLWAWRNQRLFEAGKPFKPIESIKSRALEFFFVGPQLPKAKQKVPKTIHWNPPAPGSFKLNTDGAINTTTGWAGGGGLIRDHNGLFVKGFARKIGRVDSLTAELWALRDGLQLALDMNYTSIVVEIDALCAITLVFSDTLSHPLISLLHDCRCLLSRLHVDEIKHVFREGNRAADALAHMGCNLVCPSLPSNVLSIFHVPPSEIACCISLDANRVGSIRLCNLNSF